MTVSSTLSTALKPMRIYPSAEHVRGGRSRQGATHRAEERSVGHDSGKEKGGNGKEECTEEKLIDVVGVRVCTLTKDIPFFACMQDISSGLGGKQIGGDTD